MASRSNWRLVGWMALGLIGMTAGIVAYAGSGEIAVRMIVRATARTSLTLFLLAFCASSLRRIFRNSATAWLLRNRRYIGVSFAVSHTIHLAAIATLARHWPHPFREQSASIATLAGGGLAYVFIVAMVATSFDRTAAWLGRRRWRALHTIGNYYILMIFAQTYLVRALKAPVYIPAALAIVLALGLRLFLWLRPRHDGA